MIKNTFYWIFCAVIFLLSSHLYADAKQFDDGVAAVEKQDYMTAYQVFRDLAQRGNVEAQYNLAILYRQGKGVMQDHGAALKWFQKAAEQGLASAEYYLGHLHDVGDGVSKDVALAATWYKKAAQNGNPLAQSNLGVAYANGDGVKQDIILAYVWFSLAASQGLTAALENRNLLKKQMSDELQSNARRLTREYFNKYVSPFQAQMNKPARSRYPGVSDAQVTDAHRGINKSDAGRATSTSSEVAKTKMKTKPAQE